MAKVLAKICAKIHRSDPLFAVYDRRATRDRRRDPGRPEGRKIWPRQSVRIATMK